MLPISAKKYKDLPCLKRFCCNSEADVFYTTLSYRKKVVILMKKLEEKPLEENETVKM